MGGNRVEIIVIGGSAGSIPVLMQILDALPGDFRIPVVIVLHRLKNVFSEMEKILAYNTQSLRISEPEDKTPIKENNIYLAPQNYHLLVEEDRSFSLDYSEQVNYCRPSIDVSFKSIAEVYKKNTMAILLSGANQDGASGLSDILAYGGVGIVQDPASAEYPVMPEAAIKINSGVQILMPQDIVNILSNPEL